MLWLISYEICSWPAFDPETPTEDLIPKIPEFVGRLLDALRKGAKTARKFSILSERFQTLARSQACSIALDDACCDG